MASTITVAGNTEQTQPENRVFYPALDGLRAIAFLMVFAWHYWHLPFSWVGVNIFFVLSGFLITGILYDTRFDRHRVRNFYIRRTLRIFPLYYGVFFALLLVYPFAHWRWTWSWLLWPAYLGNFAVWFHPIVPETPYAFLVQAHLEAAKPFLFAPLRLGHFWSLCVEEQFYLCWPCVVFVIKDRRKLISICLVMIVICLLGRMACMRFLPNWLIQNEAASHSAPFRVDDLLWGALVALLLRGDSGAKVRQYGRILTPTICIPVAAWFAWNTPWRHIRSHPFPYPAGTETWGFTVIAFISVLVLLRCLEPASAWSKCLGLPWLRWVGRISYGAYVFHDIFHDVLPKVIGTIDRHLAKYGLHSPVSPTSASGIPWVDLLALVLTLSLAWLSFRFFESPFLNLKERLTIR